MRRLLPLLGLIPIAGAGLLLCLPAPPAAAQAPAQQGWWVAYNSGQTAPAVGAVTSPTPDVPSSGMLVEGGPTGPTAYAGLVYYLDPGAAAGTLSLSVAPKSFTTPNSSLMVCPLVNGFINAEQGGPMSDAPAYQSKGCVTASPDSSGAGYKFDVSGMVSSGSLAVAILPTAATDRVVFDQPDAGSLSVQASPPATVPPEGGFPAGSPATVPLAGGTVGVESPVANQPAPPGPALSPPPSHPSSPVPTPGQNFDAFPAFAVTPQQAAPLAVALVLTGLLGGAALWTYAGRRRPDEPPAEA